MGIFKKHMREAEKKRKRREKQQRKAQKRPRQPKRLSRKKRNPAIRVRRSPIKDFWAGVKRAILVCSALLFCGFLFAAYSEFHGMFSSRSGRVLTWSAGTALSPVANSLPWWFWGGMIGLAIYWWVKHKLVMSIIYGILAGIYLAL